MQLCFRQSSLKCSTCVEPAGFSRDGNHTEIMLGTSCPATADLSLYIWYVQNLCELSNNIRLCRTTSIGCLKKNTRVPSSSCWSKSHGEPHGEQAAVNWCLYWPLWIHHNTHECVQYCSCLHLWVSVMCWSHARRVMRRIVSVCVFSQALQQRPLKGLIIRLRDQKLQQQVTDAVDQMPEQSYSNMVNIKQVKYNHLTQKMYSFLTVHLS